jgi:hypothetical protein
MVPILKLGPEMVLAAKSLAWTWWLRATNSVHAVHPPKDPAYTKSKEENFNQDKGFLK